MVNKMKILLDKTPYNVVAMDDETVTILDPSLPDIDQRRIVFISEHTIKLMTSARRKPKKVKRKRMTKLELCFSKSPLNPMKQLNIN